MNNAALPERYRALIATVLRACRRQFGDNLVSLAVFGSVARNTYVPGSDIDLLLVFNSLPTGRFKRTDIFASVENDHDVIEQSAILHRQGYAAELSPVLKTIAEITAHSTLMFDMTLEAVILHDTDEFLRRALVALKKRLDHLGAKRLFKGARWYWLLKPDMKPGEVFEI